MYVDYSVKETDRGLGAVSVMPGWSCLRKSSNIVDGNIPIGVERVRVVMELTLYQSSFGPLTTVLLSCLL
jgi:hypothetical protein